MRDSKYTKLLSFFASNAESNTETLFTPQQAVQIGLLILKYIYIKLNL